MAVKCDSCVNNVQAVVIMSAILFCSSDELNLTLCDIDVKLHLFHLMLWLNKNLKNI